MYLALFYSVAIGRHDRALYTAKAMELLGRRRLRLAVPARSSREIGETTACVE